MNTQSPEIYFCETPGGTSIPNGGKTSSRKVFLSVRNGPVNATWELVRNIAPAQPFTFNSSGEATEPFDNLDPGMNFFQLREHSSSSPISTWGVLVETEEESITKILGLTTSNKITISPDGKRAYLCGFSQTNDALTTVIDTEARRIIKTIPSYRGGAFRIGVSNDSSRFYVSTWTEKGYYLEVFNASDHSSLGKITTEMPGNVVVDPAGRYAYLVGFSGGRPNNGKLEKIDVINFRLIHTAQLQDNSGHGAISPNGTYVYATNPNGNDVAQGSISVYDIASSRVIKNIDTVSNVQEVVASPDGSTIFSVSYTRNMLIVIDVRTLSVTHQIPLEGPAYFLAISPDGKYLITSTDTTGLIIDTRNFTIKRFLPGDPFKGPAFSSDGRYVWVIKGTEIWIIPLSMIL